MLSERGEGGEDGEEVWRGVAAKDGGDDWGGKEGGEEGWGDKKH